MLMMLLKRKLMIRKISKWKVGKTGKKRARLEDDNYWLLYYIGLTNKSFRI